MCRHCTFKLAKPTKFNLRTVASYNFFWGGHAHRTPLEGCSLIQKVPTSQQKSYMKPPKFAFKPHANPPPPPPLLYDPGVCTELSLVPSPSHPSFYLAAVEKKRGGRPGTTYHVRDVYMRRVDLHAHAKGLTCPRTN